jgi:hypothetical protein
MRIKALAIGLIILIAQGLAAEAADVKLIIATPMAGAAVIALMSGSPTTST